MIVLVMGVAGTGKSTVGIKLARAVSAQFIEGDAYHPARNVARMERGEPLTDADRKPWLARLRAAIEAEEGDVVVACSALKSAYRKVLLQGLEATVVFLDAPPDVLRKRLTKRKGHFFGPELLESQLDTLEEPKSAVKIDATRDVDDIVAELAKLFGVKESVDGGKLRALVRRRLLALPGVTEVKSRFSKNVAFHVGKKEFLHFHSDTEVDVRLPRPLQKTLKGDGRVTFRPRPADWVEFRYADEADVDYLLELAQAAIAG